MALNRFGPGVVALCCDHSGFDLKEKTKAVLSELGIRYVDFGTYVNKNCDQVDYTTLACNAISSGACSHGLGFCRTGQAINMAANRCKGIRAALIYDEYSAEYSIRHNGANFFSVSSKVISDMKPILETLMDATFEGGRHQVRVKKIMELQ